MDAEKKEKFRKITAENGVLIERIIAIIYKHLLSKEEENSFVIDGGAHVGFHTFQLAELTSVAKVYAFEANPKTADILEANVVASPVGTKISVCRAALQNDGKKNTVSYLMSTSHPGRSGISPSFINNKETKYSDPIEVSAVTIDKLIRTNENTQCKFIKLDLEGAEFLALQGAINLLKSSTPIIVFENSKNMLANNDLTFSEFQGFFKKLNYILLTTFGEEIQSDNLSDYWYVWAVPKYNADVLHALLVKAINNFLKRY